MTLHAKKLQALLENTSQAGIYHLPDSGQTAVREAAAALGFVCFEVDFADATRLDSVLIRLAQVLDFPDWYGRNLDALKDCLTDLSWCEAPGYVLIITRAEPLHAEHIDDFRRLNQVFAQAIVEWRALTVIGLDRIAAAVRDVLGLDEAAFPLARVLEGGTWSAGRRVAAQRRPGGGPPISLLSDGTVF